MNVKTVYLAGGINGLSDDDAKGWRERVKALLPREIGVLDPMSRDYRGVEDANAAEIVRGDLHDIGMCQALIAYCPRPSWGTAMEIHYASTTSRPVVAIVPGGTPVSPWVRHFANAVVETLEEAAAWVASL